MSFPNLAQIAAALITLILSLTVHEFAHAWAAYRLGDDTSKRMGRLTLDPLPHIDPIGTIGLPLVLMLSGTGFLFGWAKPVPVDPSRFRRDVHMWKGMAWTAAAGPLANLAFALVAVVIAGLLIRFAPQTLLPGSGIGEFLFSLVGLNVLLALFNLLPVPPLDGSRIVDGYLPYRLRPGWERFTSYAPFLLLGVFVLGGRIVAGPTYALSSLFYRLAAAIGGA